jgi:predicted TIM-barrel fold metal-dependent hydrolase
MGVARLISADSHVLEPADLWTARIERRFRDRAPRVVKEAGGLRGDLFVCEDLRPIPVAGLGVAGVDPREYPEKMFSGYESVRPSGWDPVERLKDQDRDGVAAEVLYTSLGMVLYGIADGKLRAASFRAYNDWLAEYCSHAPRRLAGVALLPLDEVRDAVREIERAARLGLRGGLLWGEPPADRPYDRPEWDPVWAAAQQAALPLSLHILTGRRGPGVERGLLRDYPALHHPIERSLTDLIVGGVLERFPRLRIVSAENDVGWIGHYLQRLDHAFEKYRFLERDAVIPDPPSSYFRRQVSATFQEDPIGIRTRDAIGVGSLMWASDFPHSDSTWPRSRAVIERDFADVPEPETRRIVAENCARLYGID